MTRMTTSPPRSARLRRNRYFLLRSASERPVSTAATCDRLADRRLVMARAVRMVAVAGLRLRLIVGRERALVCPPDL